MSLPSNISTGRVTGQFIVGVADGGDPDDEPDFIPAKGTIAFTASTPYLPNPTSSPNPVTMLNTTILAVLDDAGYLCTPHPADPNAPGRRGIRLVATDDPDASVEGWTWKATPKFVNVNGAPISDAIKTFDFALPSGSTVDLTTVVKVPASQGIGTEQAEALAAAAQASAAAAAVSVEGALAAAKSAQESARAAAANLVELGNNTAAAVEREIINEGTPARSAVEMVAGQAAMSATAPIAQEIAAIPGKIAGAVAPVDAKLRSAADPLAYLNSIDILCSWDTRPAGSEETYPQAISINEAAGEIYVSNQGGTLLRIDVRNMDGTKKSSRSIATDSGAYTQTLPWFYNDAGDLCFMVRPGAGADPDTGTFSYAIYNYTKGTSGPRVPIKGDNMADVQGNFYVTTDGGNLNIRSFHIYDWPSIKAGAPILLSSIPVPGSKVSAAKNQGLVVNGGNIFLLQGAAETNATISVYDLSGKLVTIHDYNLADFANAVNRIRPGAITNPSSYTYENEGGCKYQGRLATLDVLNNSPDIQYSKTYVVLHNIVGGAVIPLSVKPFAHDTNWVPLTLTSPFVEYGQGYAPAIRRSGNLCFFRGSVKGLPAAPASNIVCKVPAEFRPAMDRQLTQMSSAGYTTNWQLGSNGDLKLLQNRDTSPTVNSWYPLPSTPWTND